MRRSKVKRWWIAKHAYRYWCFTRKAFIRAWHMADTRRYFNVVWPEKGRDVKNVVSTSYQRFFCKRCFNAVPSTLYQRDFANVKPISINRRRLYVESTLILWPRRCFDVVTVVASVTGYRPWVRESCKPVQNRITTPFEIKLRSTNLDPPEVVTGFA